MRTNKTLTKAMTAFLESNLTDDERELVSGIQKDLALKSGTLQNNESNFQNDMQKVIQILQRDQPNWAKMTAEYQTQKWTKYKSLYQYLYRVRRERSSPPKTPFSKSNESAQPQTKTLEFKT